MWILTVAAQPCGAVQLLVTLSSGRSFVGEVSARTGDDRLWLRTSSGAVELLRPIDWRRIVSGEYEGRAYDPQEIRALALSLRTDDPQSHFGDESSFSDLPAVGAATGPPLAEQATEILDFRPVIRSIECDAYLANWDADVEADGLIVQVFPLDEFGAIAAADGTIDVTLLAFQRRDLDQAVRSRGQSLERIGQWTLRLDAEAVGREGVVFKLPYQAIHPEFDTAQAPIGIVNVRLAAPGHGVFEDSVDDVRIRRYSAVRDALERHTGRRFPPIEQTNRGR